MFFVATRSGKITEEALSALRATLGAEAALPQFNTAATADAVRHYAHGRGDDNPLFCDTGYGHGTARGCCIAPATFVLTCGFPRSRGLPGVHGLFTGIDLECHRPIPVGSQIVATSALHELRERQGQFGGRQFQQTTVTRYRSDDGALFSTLYSHAFRMEREQAGSSKKFAGLERKQYQDTDLAEVEAAYAREVGLRRGGQTLCWEDVTINEPLVDMVKGPLTVTDNIAFLIGFGTVFVKAHRLWYEFRSRHPGAGVKDEHGVWDVPERVHWDEHFARAIGMPGPYDYGPQRIAWFDHRVSDWMGDAGWLRRLSVSLRAPNFVGDTTWIRGHVDSKSDDGTVTLALRAEDHRGRTTATATATVELPRRR
ncbi:MAG: MaoC family dehydratase N-terminal domain-containing protein [Dehalococcoidia bacterium]